MSVSAKLKEENNKRYENHCGTLAKTVMRHISSSVPSPQNVVFTLGGGIIHAGNV